MLDTCTWYSVIIIIIKSFVYDLYIYKCLYCLPSFLFLYFYFFVGTVLALSLYCFSLLWFGLVILILGSQMSLGPGLQTISLSYCHVWVYIRILLSMIILRDWHQNFERDLHFFFKYVNIYRYYFIIKTPQIVKIARAYNFTSTLYICSLIWRISHGHAEIGRDRIFFWMLKNISQVNTANEWNNFSSQEETFCVCHFTCEFYFLWLTQMKYRYQNIPLLLMDFRLLKSVIYYVTIVMMIIPHAKITCYFHVWGYHVFLWKLTWNLFGVYIISNYYFVF